MKQKERCQLFYVISAFEYHCKSVPTNYESRGAPRGLRDGKRTGGVFPFSPSLVKLVTRSACRLVVVLHLHGVKEVVEHRMRLSVHLLQPLPSPHSPQLLLNLSNLLPHLPKLP